MEREREVNVIIMCIGLDRYKTLLINWVCISFAGHTHLVKLVDETHTLISQHQCPCLQGPLLRDGTPLHVSHQNHGPVPWCTRALGLGT